MSREVLCLFISRELRHIERQICGKLTNQ